MPFYVAAPCRPSTCRRRRGPTSPSRSAIPTRSRTSAAGAWRPPGRTCTPRLRHHPQANITAIITEVGVLRPPYDRALRRACRDGQCAS